MLAQVKIYSSQILSRQWIIGRGWTEKKWPEQRFPSIQELDLISKDKPIALEREDGHAIIVNTLALELAGIDRNTPDPIGGKIDKDINGNPSGILIDNASLLVAVSYTHLTLPTTD